MHPMFVKLFIETDADDLLAGEQDKHRHRRPARRSRSARVMRVVARNARAGPDRCTGPHRPW
jgi:hypothetical protein